MRSSVFSGPVAQLPKLSVSWSALPPPLKKRSLRKTRAVPFVDHLKKSYDNVPEVPMMFSSTLLLISVLLTLTLVFSFFILIDGEGKGKALAVIPPAIAVTGMLLVGLAIIIPSDPKNILDMSSIERSGIAVSGLSAFVSLVLLLAVHRSNRSKDPGFELDLSADPDTIGEPEPASGSELSAGKIDFYEITKAKETKMPFNPEKQYSSDMAINIQKAITTAVDELLRKAIHEVVPEAANNSANLEIEKSLNETSVKLAEVDEKLQKRLSEIEEALAEATRMFSEEKQEAIARSKEEIDSLNAAQAEKEKHILAIKDEALRIAENAIQDKSIPFELEKVESGGSNGYMKNGEIENDSKKERVESVNRRDSHMVESISDDISADMSSNRFKGLKI